MGQTEMQAFLKNTIEELTKNKTDSLIGMMEPRFVSCSSDNETLSVLFNTKLWMRNPVGILHGGMTAAMMDNAMGMLVRYYTPEHNFAPTMNMSIDYIRQIPINEAVVIKACIISKGSTVIRTRAEMHISGKEGVVASAVATYFVRGF